MKFKLSLLVLFVLLMGGVEASQGQLTLLTIGERDGERFGGTADLHLEIKPGSGRIFIDSFPLSQLDTQITTRYAKTIACDFLDVDCSNKDFFYTIRARSSLVGGPSAGAAKTVLTISLLDNQRIDSDVLITGTINSGGIIGPVAGIEEKVKVAEARGFDKVLIPKWSSHNNVSSLQNVDYNEIYGVENVDVVSVSTLYDVLKEFTGKNYFEDYGDLEVPQDYSYIMSSISEDLCNRTSTLLDEVNDSSVYNNSLINYELALNATEIGNYYSSASYCFGANVQLRNSLYENISDEEKESKKDELLIQAQNLTQRVNDKELKTISDLETSIIVKERLFEAIGILEEGVDNLGYAEERLYSAFAWSGFFEYEGAEVNLDDSFLESACLTKISEAEERVNYAEFLFGTDVFQRGELSELNNIFREGDYPFCIFRATRIKSDVNSLILTSTVDIELREELAREKVVIAEQQIKSSSSFPILGYSYYIYAKDLISSDPNSAILFSEYATEFSNFGMYFEQESGRDFLFYRLVFNQPLFYFGFSLGALVVLLLVLFGRNILFKPRKISKRNPPGKKR